MNQNTVFVIGAGASQEANLPIGQEFKQKIASILDMRFEYGDRKISGDNIVYRALREVIRRDKPHNGGLNSYWEAARTIYDALPLAISIDNFIDAHRDNDKLALCGKLAIVRSILDAESKSLLYFESPPVDSNIDFGRLKETWYIPFFQLLTENCEKNDLKERFKSITLIIFNYDRCIEHFLCCALQKYFRLSESESAELVKCINIYHPYGDVGTLPWANPNGAMGFGTEPRHEQLLDLSSKIKTFTEGTAPDSSEISEIRRYMGMANKLVFIGFAFHELNMELIKPDLTDEPKIQTKCFATTYKFSPSDEEVIKEQIKKLYFPFSIEMNNKSLTCGEFFQYFRKSLAGGMASS